MEFGIEVYDSLIMWSLKRQDQETIRKLGEKENYKHLGILEADTIKHVAMKQKIQNIISDERESFLKLSL